MSVVTVESLEAKLNSLVGTEFKYKNGHGWNEIYSSSTELEIEQKRGDGCSYALMLASNSKIVLSWRYTSTRKECEKRNYVTGA